MRRLCDLISEYAARPRGRRGAVCRSGYLGSSFRGGVPQRKTTLWSRVLVGAPELLLAQGDLAAARAIVVGDRNQKVFQASV